MIAAGTTPTGTVENAGRNAQRQFDEAAELIGLDPALRAVLREVKRQLMVSFPPTRRYATEISIVIGPESEATLDRRTYP